MMLIGAAMAACFSSLHRVAHRNVTAVMRARKNSPATCRSVPHHQPARKTAGIVTPAKPVSSSTATPGGQRWNGAPPRSVGSDLAAGQMVLLWPRGWMWPGR